MMKGLRTQEGEKFERFFALVQKKAQQEGEIFFLDSGDGRDIILDEMEGENLSGWLVPAAMADVFEENWKKHRTDENWDSAYYCFAEWEMADGKIEIRFVKYVMYDDSAEEKR